MNNSEIIRRFYDAFARGDAETMASCYDDAAVFHDPAFGTLKGEDIRNMWRMLLSRTDNNIKISYDEIEADNTSGSAHWIASYNFSKTGRPVVNDIHASFIFSNGKIVSHIDHFNLYKWSRQALGFSGFLLGWTGMFQKKVQQQTQKLLKSYSEKKRDARH